MGEAVASPLGSVTTASTRAVAADAAGTVASGPTASVPPKTMTFVVDGVVVAVVDEVLASGSNVGVSPAAARSPSSFPPEQPVTASDASEMPTKSALTCQRALKYLALGWW